MTTYQKGRNNGFQPSSPASRTGARLEVRDHAHTLSDFHTLTPSIECEPCGRFGRYNVAKLIEQYGDAKLADLRRVLANCPKEKSASIYDQCQVRYDVDSRPGPGRDVGAAERPTKRSSPPPSPLVGWQHRPGAPRCADGLKERSRVNG
jgi:hypothetical protein